MTMIETMNMRVRMRHRGARSTRAPKLPRSSRLAPEVRAVASDEVAEFLLYLIRQSDKSAIDPITAANRNLLENANKFTEL